MKGISNNNYIFLTNMNTVTRKIQLIIKDEDVKETFKKLYSWNEIVFRGANYLINHLFFQENISEFFYLQEDFKLKLVDRKKDDEGVLNTSRQNTGYQLLSSKFKGQIPMAIMANLNQNITNSFKKQSKERFAGKRSVQSYKRDYPIPISTSDMINITETEDKKNYTFSLYGINFSTYFGKDLSGNKKMFSRSLSGEYKLCNSSIQMDGKKIYLLAVFQFESETVELFDDREIRAELTPTTPIKYIYRNNEYEIGSQEEFLHRRIQIQQAIKKQQIIAKYNKGGRGRKNKMKNVDYYKGKEKNYIDQKLHVYSRMLIDACLRNKCKNLILGYSDIMERSKQNDFLLRNWGWSGLLTKLEYKAKRYGIRLIVEECPELVEVEDIIMSH